MTFQTLNDTKDTVVLKHIIGDNYFNRVFVEFNRGSRHYDEALDFSFKDQGLSDWLQQDSSKKLIRFDTSMLTDEWLPLYHHRGNYFIYRPGDSDDRRIINDSIMVYYHHEALFSIIDKFDRVSPRHYRIRTNDSYGGHSKILDNLDLYIVDPVNNIAVWKYKIEGDSAPTYSLFIAKQNAKKFPLVVNDANERPDEFEFDPIDFKKLLKGIED